MRRYSRGDNDESEATTVKSNNGGNNQQGEQQGAVTQLPPRLYPDLPLEHYPGSFGGPRPQFHPQLPNHGAPTPYLPFGPQMPPNRLNGGVGGILDPTNHRQIPMQRPMTPAERAQSQTFVSGLGRRLLAMIGIEMPSSLNDTAAAATTTSSTDGQAAQPRSDQNPMSALKNSTVVQQLNKGVQSIYGSLSKMYNSTVQQQINLLQEQFRKEAENSTNPWQQRMAQQVPNFFKNMAAKVEDAQENLNRIWRQVSQANNGSLDATTRGRQQQQPVPVQTSFFDQFNNHAIDDHAYHPGNFINQVGRSLGFGGDEQNMNPNINPNGRQENDLGQRFMDFWHNQVQPQIGMVRGQMSRVWRDLMSTGGALMPDQMIRARSNNNNLGASNADNSSSEFVDNVLNSIDINNSEYSLIEPKDDQQQQKPPMNEIGSQMQTRLIEMQRELNQLWNGLANSLQGAIGNVRNALNPRPRFNTLDTMASNNNKQEPDPAQTEIGDRIKDISKLQKEADVVYDAVQNQQQAEKQQGFTDRFRNFFNDMDFGSVEQLPNRFSDSVSRFGNAVGDFWNKIPRKWDNFMNNDRQPPNQMPNARLTSSDTKPKNQTESAI